MVWVIIMKYKSIFIDTWGWLALGHRRDNYHQSVKELYCQLKQQKTLIYTSDYVLDELISLLFKRENFQEATTFIEGIMQSAELGNLQIEQVTTDKFQLAYELRKKLNDKPYISFTDLTSMIIMEQLKIQYILTQDDHFLQCGMGFIKIL
jgi:predicted nucleic acid-binding protein